MLILKPLLAIIETQVEEMNLNNGIEAVNLGNVSVEKLETHVRNGSSNFLLEMPEVWMKTEKWLQMKRCYSLELTTHTVSLSGEYK